MSRSIAAKVLANAKRQEAEELKIAKKQEEEARKKAQQQRKQAIENAKSEIIAKIQENMDGKLNCLEEWDYITGENRLRAYHFYDNILASSEIAKIAQDLGFDCKVSKEGWFAVSIPMWKKGEKKTTAQLMLYHHRMALKKRIKELKAEALVVAKRDCKEVLARLKKGDYTVAYSNQVYRILVPMVTEGLRMAFYEEVRSIMKARRLDNIEWMRNTWQIRFMKNK